MVDAILEATYDFDASHSSATGIEVITSTDIRILAFDVAEARPRIYKYTPNYDSYFDPTQNLNGCNGLTFDRTYLWYTANVPCTSDSFSIRKIKPDGTGYVCVSNSTKSISALTYHNGNIYGLSGGKIYILEADYSWTEVLDLTSIVGNYNYVGLSAIGDDFLVNEHTNNQIHYVTGSGSHAYTWNFATCTGKGHISWDYPYLWMSCGDNDKLYKLTLPPLPLESSGSALPLFAKMLLNCWLPILLIFLLLAMLDGN